MVDFGSIWLNSTYIWTERGAMIAILLIILAIFIVHCYHLRMFMAKQESRRNVALEKSRAAMYRNLSHAFTVQMFVLWILQTVIYTVNSWSLHLSWMDTRRGKRLMCTWNKRASTWTQHYGKVSLYLTLLMRLELTFYGTAYRKQIQCVLRFLYVCMIIWILIIAYGDYAAVWGELVEVKGIGGKYCAFKFEVWGVILYTIVDTVVSFSALYAFNKPLSRMLKDMDRNEKISNLLTKYAVLTTTAVMSTFIAQALLLLTRAPMLVEIDNVVNMLCVTLMSSWHEEWYYYYCCGCVRIVQSYEVARRVVRRQTIDMMRRITERSSNQSSMLDTLDVIHGRRDSDKDHCGAVPPITPQPSERVRATTDLASIQDVEDEKPDSPKSQVRMDTAAFGDEFTSKVHAKSKGSERVTSVSDGDIARDGSSSSTNPFAGIIDGDDSMSE